MDILFYIAAIGFGLMAGIYFAFSAFIMNALAEISKPAAMKAMQSINEVILRSPFMVLFFGTSMISVVLIVVALMDLNSAGNVFVLFSGSIYFLGMFLCTVFFNVPLNEKLKAAQPDTQNGQNVWELYLRVWTRWNHIRTISCLVSAAIMVLLSASV